MGLDGVFEFGYKFDPPFEKSSYLRNTEPPPLLRGPGECQCWISSITRFDPGTFFAFRPYGETFGLRRVGIMLSLSHQLAPGGRQNEIQRQEICACGHSAGHFHIHLDPP